LAELTRAELIKARAAGIASRHRNESTQIIDVMVRQLGRLFLQPMIDTLWSQALGRDESADDRPALEVAVRSGKTYPVEKRHSVAR
jgi:hypothetical protein